MFSHFLGIGEVMLEKIDTGPDFLGLRVLWRKVVHKQKHKQNNFYFNVLYRKQDMCSWGDGCPTLLRVTKENCPKYLSLS